MNMYDETERMIVRELRMVRAFLDGRYSLKETLDCIQWIQEWIFNEWVRDYGQPTAIYFTQEVGRKWTEHQEDWDKFQEAIKESRNNV